MSLFDKISFINEGEQAEEYKARKAREKDNNKSKENHLNNTRIGFTKSGIPIDNSSSGIRRPNRIGQYKESGIFESVQFINELFGLRKSDAITDYLDTSTINAIYKEEKKIVNDISSKLKSKYSKKFDTDITEVPCRQGNFYSILIFMKNQEELFLDNEEGFYKIENDFYKNTYPSMVKYIIDALKKYGFEYNRSADNIAAYEEVSIINKEKNIQVTIKPYSKSVATKLVIEPYYIKE